MGIDYVLHNRLDRAEYEYGNMKLRIIDLGHKNNKVIKNHYLNEDEFTDVGAGRREIRFFLEGAIPQPFGENGGEKESELSQAWYDGYVEGLNENIGTDHKRWFDLPMTKQEFMEGIENE